MGLQGGQVGQEIRQEAVDFGAQRIGAVFLFGGGQPAGDNVVRVHFNTGNIQLLQDLAAPLAFDSEGIEIGDQGAGPGSAGGKGAGSGRVRPEAEKKG